MEIKSHTKDKYFYMENLHTNCGKKKNTGSKISNQTSII